MNPPAFQFYPSDYLGSQRVQLLTLEQEGAYIRLLCFCWKHGSIPSDPEQCARLIGKGGSTTVARVVQAMFDKHPTDSGKLVHGRLDAERGKQADWRRKSSEGGKRSALARASSRVVPRVVEAGRLDNGANQKATLHLQSSSSSSSTSLSSEESVSDGIESIHLWYCEQMGQEGAARVLDTGRAMQWAQWFKAGYVEDDFKRVVKYLRNEIDAQKRNPGSLKLSNLLVPDSFGEDLMLSKQEFKNGNKTHQRVNQRNVGIARPSTGADYGEAAKRKLERQALEAANRLASEAQGNGNAGGPVLHGDVGKPEGGPPTAAGGQ